MFDYFNNPLNVYTKEETNRCYQQGRNIHLEAGIVLCKTIASVSSTKRAIHCLEWHINLPSDVKWNSTKSNSDADISFQIGNNSMERTTNESVMNRRPSFLRYLLYSF